MLISKIPMYVQVIHLVDGGELDDISGGSLHAPLQLLSPMS
jgi:hypothetical protein